MTNKKAQFYVVQKSNWQGDGWCAVAGPFATRQEAGTDKTANGYHPLQTTGSVDIKAEVHARIVSRTWLAENGYGRGVDSDIRILESIFAFQSQQLI